MNCFLCNMKKIGPNTALNGGFICVNGHLQCNDCNSRTGGQCGFCRNLTFFVQMTVDPTRENLAEAQARMALAAVGQPASAPFQSSSNSMSVEKSSYCYISKAMIAEIEAQPKISQEHLTMNGDSVESLAEDDCADGETNDDEQASTVLVSKKCFGSCTESVTAKKSVVTEDITPAPQLCQDPVAVQNSSGDNSLQTSKQSPLNGNMLNSDVCLNGNVFIFQEDPDDHSVIHTSEIHFLDSTESLNNLLARDSVQKSQQRQPADDQLYKSSVSAANQVELQSDVLTQKLLQEHNSSALGPTNEVVENYLLRYGPLATYHIPCYNCDHEHCDFYWNTNQAPQMMSICVSTDSDPSLRSVQPASVGLHRKFGNRDFVVMHARGVEGQPTTLNMSSVLEKGERASLDMRMQKILETFQENPPIAKFGQKQDDAKGRKFLKPTSCSEEPDALAQIHVEQPSCNIFAQENNVWTERIVNTYRAFYQPAVYFKPQVCNAKYLSNAQQLPPPAQYQVINCSSSAIGELIAAKPYLLANRPALSRYMPPLPIQCPDSRCANMIFLCDFHKHYEMDHSQLPMERIAPFQSRNMLLDTRLAVCGTSTCHMLYMLSDRITGMGSSQYKDFLPLLVMNSRISLGQLVGVNESMWSELQQPFTEFLIIWITGIVPEEFPISVSLTVWSKAGLTPTCHMVYAGDMYSIRRSQQAMDVWQSGQMLLLSPQEVHLLTNGGTEMLNVQLRVH